MSLNSSKQLHQEQVARDIAHHQNRVKWLEGDSPKWACGTSVSKGERFRMLEASKLILQNPMLGYNTGSQH